MFDLSTRFEWLELSTEQAHAVAVASVVATGACRRCPRCRWLDRVREAACANCGLAFDAVAGDTERVELPPAEVTVDDAGALATGGDAAPEALALLAALEDARRARGFDRLVALDAMAIERFEHQERAALRVLRDLGGRAILADASGLGKTIEACIVVAELMARGLATRVLVLAPTALLEHWRTELLTRVGARFHVAAGPEDIAAHDRVIAALPTAQRARTAAAVHARSWDLLVVDEAHALHNPENTRHRFVRAIQSRYALLLTAVPVRHSLEDLHALVEIVRPGLLGTRRQFRRQHLARHDPRAARDPAGLRTLLDQVLIRTRRRDLPVPLPPRRAAVAHVSLDPIERRAHATLAAHAQRAWAALPQSHPLGAALPSLARRLCSSPAALLAALEPLCQDLRLAPAEREALCELRDYARAASPGAKVRALRDVLARLPGPVVVFTEYIASLDAVAAALRDDGIPAACYHGGLAPRARREALARFEDGSARVLVCTDAGAEGLDLHVCHQLVHFDLPWSPATVEKRTGRVHRLGQTREVIAIALATEGTADAHLAALLAKRLRAFELGAGEAGLVLDALGPQDALEAQLAYLSLEADESARARGFDALGETLARARSVLDEVRAVDAALDAITTAE
jgi:SNF2 family DNA or RNA helicase